MELGMGKVKKNHFRNKKDTTCIKIIWNIIGNLWIIITVNMVQSTWWIIGDIKERGNGNYSCYVQTKEKKT